MVDSKDNFSAEFEDDSSFFPICSDDTQDFPKKTCFSEENSIFWKMKANYK